MERKGLTPLALSYINTADVVIGAAQTLARLEAQLSSHSVRRDLTGQLHEVPKWISAAQAQAQRTVVLATGDPLCHGIAEHLINRLGLHACEVIPNVSTVQLACARLGLAWQQMKICSVHGQDTGEWLPGAGPAHGLFPLLQALNQYVQLAVLTSPRNSPGRIARMLCAEEMDSQFQVAVAERLLQPEERIMGSLPASKIATLTFAHPNVMVLWRESSAAQAHERLFGLADDGFAQRKPDKGLITKREVRAVSLALLGLCRDSIVWDIGAGSGAVGLEAARLCVQGHVYAAEKNAQDIAIARANRKKLKAYNYTLLHTEAPAGLESWPDPDAIFIGGSGGRLSELILYCLGRVRRGASRLVTNVVTVENLWCAIDVLRRSQATWQVTQLQVAHSQVLQQKHRFAPENPVWIIAAEHRSQL